MPDIRKNFAAGLTYLITRLGVVQKELADAAGCEAQDITDYKAGRRKGSEAERNRIAERLGVGLPEHLIRELGFLIRGGMNGDEAFERVKARATNGSSNVDEIVRFNRALDNFFDQIREFLRDEYGENMHTAIVFEERMTKRMPLFSAWKSKLSLDLMGEDESIAAEPLPQYASDQAAPQQNIL